MHFLAVNREVADSLALFLAWRDNLRDTHTVDTALNRVITPAGKRQLLVHIRDRIVSDHHRIGHNLVGVSNFVVIAKYLDAIAIHVVSSLEVGNILLQRPNRNNVLSVKIERVITKPRAESIITHTLLKNNILCFIVGPRCFVYINSFVRPVNRVGIVFIDDLSLLVFNLAI